MQTFLLVVETKVLYVLLFEYSLVYIIISGNQAESFLDLYEEEFQNYTLFSSNIIFCRNLKEHLNKKYSSHLLYNPPGVTNNFDEVIKYIYTNQNHSIEKFFSIRSS